MLTLGSLFDGSGGFPLVAVDEHSDADEYKMWGNGIALPCAEFVFESIVKQTRY